MPGGATTGYACLCILPFERRCGLHREHRLTLTAYLRQKRVTDMDGMVLRVPLLA